MQNFFPACILQPMAIDLISAGDGKDRIKVLLRQLLAESSCPLVGHTPMLEWLTRSVLLLLVRLHSDQRSADPSGRQDF